MFETSWSFPRTFCHILPSAVNTRGLALSDSPSWSLSFSTLFSLPPVDHCIFSYPDGYVGYVSAIPYSTGEAVEKCCWCWRQSWQTPCPTFPTLSPRWRWSTTPLRHWNPPLRLWRSMASLGRCLKCWYFHSRTVFWLELKAEKKIEDFAMDFDLSSSHYWQKWMWSRGSQHQNRWSPVRWAQCAPWNTPWPWTWGRRAHPPWTSIVDPFSGFDLALDGCTS